MINFQLATITLCWNIGFLSVLCQVLDIQTFWIRNNFLYNLGRINVIFLYLFQFQPQSLNKGICYEQHKQKLVLLLRASYFAEASSVLLKIFCIFPVASHRLFLDLIFHNLLHSSLFVDYFYYSTLCIVTRHNSSSLAFSFQQWVVFL